MFIILWEQIRRHKKGIDRHLLIVYLIKYVVLSVSSIQIMKVKINCHSLSSDTSKYQ